MNFYNEFDPKAASWLRQLVADQVIPKGVVDERSITDLDPEELSGYTQCHFFAGIGGWSLALELAGWREDRQVWTGSPPCQSFSSAGKQRGKDDERHLWPAFFDLIRFGKPSTIFGEQVSSAIKFGWFDDLQKDLEGEGYATGLVVLPACGIGAPHKRERLFYVAERLAYPESSGSRGELRHVHGSDEASPRSEEQHSDSTGQRSDDSGNDRPVAYSDAHGRNEGLQPLQGEESERSGSDSFDSGLVGDSNDTRLQMHRRHGELHLREQVGSSENGLSADSSISSGRMAYPTTDGRKSGSGEEPGRERKSGGCQRCSLWQDGCNCGATGRSVGNASDDGQPTSEIGRSTPETGNWEQEGSYLPGNSQGAGRSEGARDLCNWEASRLIHCRDGKVRPIPTEPDVLAMAHGFSSELADVSDQDVKSVMQAMTGFPLIEKGLPNRVAILKGAGNAIVPQIAAEVIRAHMEFIDEVKGG